jgi:hypothetical protein
LISKKLNKNSDQTNCVLSEIVLDSNQIQLCAFRDRTLQQNRTNSERSAFVTATLWIKRKFWQWIRLLRQSKFWQWLRHFANQNAGSEFIHFVNQKENLAVDQFALSIEILAVATSTLSIKVLAVDSSTLSSKIMAVAPSILPSKILAVAPSTLPIEILAVAASTLPNQKQQISCSSHDNKIVWRKCAAKQRKEKQIKSESMLGIRVSKLTMKNNCEGCCAFVSACSKQTIWKSAAAVMTTEESDATVQ